MKAQVVQAEKSRDEARKLLQTELVQRVIIPAMDLAGEILVGTHLDRPLPPDKLAHLADTWRIAARRLYIHLGDDMANKINGPVQGYINQLVRYSGSVDPKAAMKKHRDQVSHKLAAINNSIYHFSSDLLTGQPSKR